jgi:hypothetical protein
MKNLDKLPKWAQTEVLRLENEVEFLQRKLDQVTGVADTNTFLLDGLNKKPLPMNSQVEFRVGDKLQNKVSVYIRRDGFIDVNGDARDGSTFVILPRAANSFYLAFVPDK